MLNHAPLKLSPSQQRILEVFYQHGNRVYSWQLAQEAKTADYRARIGNLRRMGYQIEGFSESAMAWNEETRAYNKRIVRHGYILIPPSKVNP